MADFMWAGYIITYQLTNLCGTATNIWLRPVEEDHSMIGCLEQSASNL
jgi:hypothetical protein